VEPRGQSLQPLAGFVVDQFSWIENDVSPQEFLPASHTIQLAPDLHPQLARG
jgi:hypothetical protein